MDTILLGLGDDGHTASLYPGTPACTERKRWVVAHYVPQRNGYRITLTLPLLNAARQVVFLVAGGAKADALAQVLQAESPQPTLPASGVRPCGGSVSFLVDREAASLLPLRH